MAQHAPTTSDWHEYGQERPLVPRAQANAGQTERWLTLGAGAALAVFGLTRRSLLGLPLAASGGYLAWRALTTRAPLSAPLTALPGISRVAPRVAPAAQPAPATRDVWKSVTINRTREEVYQFWRELNHLPRFMQHLESVTPLDGTRSHWVARAPLGRTVAWDAEITADQPNDLIAWRALPGSRVQHSGTVRFVAAPAGRGTEVHARIIYQPPAGDLGAAIAKLFGEEPTQQVDDDLLHLKEVLEAGEVPTTRGQSAGRRSLLGRLAARAASKGTSESLDRGVSASAERER